MVPACGGARPSHLNVNYAQLVPPMPVLVKIPNFGSGGGVVPVLTTGVEMAPNGTRASARDLRTQPGASEPSPIKSRYVVLRWSRFFEISGFCRASSAGKDTEVSV